MSGLIDAGSYRATAEGGAQFGFTKNGHEQVAVRFRLLDGEHEGRFVTWYSGFSTEKAEEITIKGLRAAGWQGNDITKMQLDQEVMVQVEIDDYDPERLKNRVAFVNPLDGGPLLSTPMAEGDLRKFAARIGRKAANYPSQERRANPAPAGNGQPPQRQQERPPARQQERPRPPQQQGHVSDPGWPQENEAPPPDNYDDIAF